MKYRRFKKILIVGLVIVAVFTAGCEKENKGMDKQDSLIDVGYAYIEESIYNESKVRKHYTSDETIPFQWLEIVDTVEALDILAKEGEFVFPYTFDFENSCMLIAYGMKIVGLECKKDVEFRDMFFLTVTFEEKHQGEKVFFYQIEKRKYLPPFLGVNCYIMKGNERVFAGYGLPL